MGFQLFIPDEVLEQMGIVPLLMLMYFYGSILYSASCRISDGSEMLLLLYGPGVVGGLVIPILGAIPDGAIILISGMGSGTKEEIQKELAVGVGTLAGSTIMLITIPWAIGVYLGRRDIENGVAATDRVKGKVLPKYTTFSWSNTGVTAFPEIPVMAKTMMITSLLYLIIQVPAFLYHLDKDASKEERSYAEFGLAASLIAFILYSWYQLHSAKSSEVVEQKQREYARMEWKRNIGRHMPPGKSLELVFNKFDVNGDGTIDRGELVNCLKSLGLDANRQVVNEIMREMDSGDPSGVGAGDNAISLHEFEVFFSRMLANQHHQSKRDLRPNDEDLPSVAVSYDDVDTTRERLLSTDGNDDQWGDDCEEEEEEFPHLSDSAIFWRALLQLAIGAGLVTIFSEPMVDTINVFADKAHISAFYVSFVVTPLASNASEVIAALVFAAKRNNSGISLTFGSLYGAANMNNTFALCIFLGLIVFRKLQWSFSAEVIAILVVTFVVGAFGMCRTIRMWQAAIVASLYPLSMMLVYVLKASGLDNTYSKS